MRVCIPVAYKSIPVRTTATLEGFVFAIHDTEYPY